MRTHRKRHCVADTGRVGYHAGRELRACDLGQSSRQEPADYDEKRHRLDVSVRSAANDFEAQSTLEGWCEPAVFLD